MESQGIDVGKVEVMCGAPCDCCRAHDWLDTAAAICTWRHDCTMTYSASCWPQSMSWYFDLKTAIPRVSSSLCIGQPASPKMEMSDFMSLLWLGYNILVWWFGSELRLKLCSPLSLSLVEQMKNIKMRRESMWLSHFVSLEDPFLVSEQWVLHFQAVMSLSGLPRCFWETKKTSAKESCRHGVEPAQIYICVHG